MYVFRIDGENPKQEKIPQSTKQIGEVEFTNIVKPADGFNKQKFKEIRKSKIELLLTKPRNAFMIFRSLVKQLILKKMADISFAEISKISSLVCIFLKLF